MSRGARWGRSEQIGQLFNIRRAIADANNAVADELAEGVRAARENVRLTLLSHDLITASVAVRMDGELQRPYREFAKMAQRIREGGYHASRRRAGGMLDHAVDE